MKNGKISKFLKDNWRSILFAVAVFAGILCGFWACAQSPTVDIDAHRNRVIIQLPATIKK